MVVVNPAATWSAGIATTTHETPLQCHGGHVRVAWGASAPASVLDGFELSKGEALVLPAGQTFYHVASRGGEPTLFYELFQ
tara:strand:+ start:5330 stop:5572 length:243 start_codon:yes stop_codon:yes gene_type:complete